MTVAELKADVISIAERSYQNDVAAATLVAEIEAIEVVLNGGESPIAGFTHEADIKTELASVRAHLNRVGEDGTDEEHVDTILDWIDVG